MPRDLTTMTLDELLAAASDADAFPTLKDMGPIVRELKRRLAQGEAPSDVAEAARLARGMRESFERRLARVC